MKHNSLTLMDLNSLSAIGAWLVSALRNPAPLPLGRAGRQPPLTGGMVMTGMFVLMLLLILTSVRQNFSAGERLSRLRRDHLNRSIEV